MPAAVVTGIPASDTTHESPVEIPDGPQPMSPTLLETPTEPDMITRRASTMSTIPASEEEIAGMAAAFENNIPALATSMPAVPLMPTFQASSRGEDLDGSSVSEETINARKNFWAKFKKVKTQSLPDPASPVGVEAAAPAIPSSVEEASPAIPSSVAPATEPEIPAPTTEVVATIVAPEPEIPVPMATEVVATTVAETDATSVEPETPVPTTTEAFARTVAEAGATSVEPETPVPTITERPTEAVAAPPLVAPPTTPVASLPAHPPAETSKKPAAEVSLAKSDSPTEEALKRLTTVDLENGQKPGAFATSAVMLSTPQSSIVLVKVGDKLEPVEVTLSAAQCRAAGFVLLSDAKSGVCAPAENHAQKENRQALGLPPDPTGVLQSFAPPHSASPDSPAGAAPSSSMPSEPPALPPSQQLSPPPSETPPGGMRVKEEGDDTDAEEQKKQIRAAKARLDRSLRSATHPEVKAKFAELQKITAQHGAQSKEAKAVRAQLFEEFVQANEDWNASTMVINSRTTQSEKKRGVYKLMSEEDLLEKYRGNKDMVASIIKDKEELGMWERNPDYKEQKMYHCWDATATIRDNTHATSTEVTTEGGISTQDAQPMLLDASALPTASGALDGGNADERDDRKKNKPKTKAAPKPNTENKTGAIPKLKTAEQEAKTAMSAASSMILECKGEFGWHA